MNATNKKEEELVEHYTRLLGFREACLLLARRNKAANKLDKKKNRDRVEGLASSKPDGRLNAPNLSLGSLVGRMGGKRKQKKSKRGY